LMRARLPVQELARYDRKGLRLTDASVRRLRDYMAHAADTQGSGDSSSR
jgi:hypothetical protein